MTMRQNILGKDVEVVAPKNLYKWASVWGRVQKNYYKDKVILRREKQIQDFIRLNGFEKLHIIKDTDVFPDLISVDEPSQADIVIVTDQKFSRLPCPVMIEQIQALLTRCPRLYMCLNRHYINIDNSYRDQELDAHFPLAVTQWLKKNLLEAKVIDMSLDVLDRGDWFTWVIPDRMYYIERA